VTARRLPVEVRAIVYAFAAYVVIAVLAGCNSEALSKILVPAVEGANVSEPYVLSCYEERLEDCKLADDRSQCIEAESLEVGPVVQALEALRVGVCSTFPEVCAEPEVTP